MRVALRGDVGPVWPLPTAAGVILMALWRGLRCVGLAQEAGFSGALPCCTHTLHPPSPESAGVGTHSGSVSRGWSRDRLICLFSCSPTSGTSLQFALPPGPLLPARCPAPLPATHLRRKGLGTISAALEKGLG